MPTNNNLGSNTSDIVLKKILPMFTSDVVACNTVDRQIVGDGVLNPDTGDRIAVKRPMQFRSKRTADGDISGQDKNKLISGNAFAVVQDYITVDIEYGQVEEALQLNQLEQLLMPVRDRIVTDLETSLVEYMNLNSSHFLGTAGAQISKWSDVAQTNSFMQDFGFPAGERYAMINPWGAQNLADAQSGVPNLPGDKVTSAWEQAQITRNFGGVRAYTSNALTTHINGNQVSNSNIEVASAPIQTYESTKDTYTMQLALTGLTASTGTINAGDTLAIGGGVNWVNQNTKKTLVGPSGTPIQYKCTVVQGGTANGSGDLTVVVTGPAVFEVDGQFNTVDAAIQGGYSVTVVSGATDGSTVKPNLFYHKSAFGLSTVRLPKLHAKESSVAEYGGFTMRVHKYSDGDANLQKMRFDLLPAFATFNPLMAGKFYGNP